MKIKTYMTTGMILLAFCGIVRAETEDDAVELQGLSITAEEELPLGLFIVPWKEPEPIKVDNPPTRLVVEPLAPLDQVVFRRQLNYFGQLNTQVPAEPAQSE